MLCLLPGNLPIWGLRIDVRAPIRPDSLDLDKYGVDRGGEGREARRRSRGRYIGSQEGDMALPNRINEGGGALAVVHSQNFYKISYIYSRTTRFESDIFPIIFFI